MIRQKIYDDTEVQLISDQPLTLLQLSLLTDEIRDDLCVYRPEFANLVRLQRKIGCRVQELFDAERWQLVSNSVLKLTPQKKNAVRILQLADIGFADDFIYQELDKPISRRSLPFIHLLPQEAISSFKLWTENPDKTEY